MKSNILQSHLSFIIILAVFLFICGCATNQPNPDINISNVTPENISANISNGTSENLSIAQPPEIFDVKIKSLTCDWTVKTDQYNVKSDCVRGIANGTAQGPVGTRVELPLFIWSDDTWDCGEWTHQTGALIAAGHTCVRKEGQPESTNWTVDTGSDRCPLKNYFDNERSYSAKIYKDDELEPRQQDSKTVVCE